MNAICKCKCGHTFTSMVVADEPDTNYFEIADDCCPECGSTEFEIADTEPDYEDFYDSYETK